MLNHDVKKEFRRFYFDALEESERPGSVFLFGKIFMQEKNTCMSCCVAVKSMERTIYLLTRSEHRLTKEVVSMPEV